LFEESLADESPQAGAAKIAVVGAAATGLASSLVWGAVFLLLGTGRISAAAAGTAVFALRSAATGLQYSTVDSVRFLVGDAVDHLHRAEPYDLVFSVHGLTFLDPHRSMPAIHRGLLPGGRLVFSALHTDLHRRPPSHRVEPRQLQVRLKGLQPLDVHLWVLTPQLWEDALTDHNFTVEAIDLLHRPADDPVVDQLIQARRRP
jgi:SAM-dependent methyltransferase